MSPSTNQAGTDSEYHCQQCKLAQTKDEPTIKALLRGIRTHDELQDWMHALNTQEMDTELKEYAAAQGDEL